MIRFEQILEKVEAYNPQFDEDLLRRAYVFSAREHKGQVRRSGEPYLIHPLNVASILAELKADDVSIVVGLLHDVLEDTLTSKESIAQQFGAEVADLVDGLTKISRIAYVSREEAQAETFRKMVLAMVSDLRVVLVKLADRLHNMRTLEHLAPERRREIARETMDIYAPIANRLGMGLLKGELEDLAFRHLEPEEYARVSLEVERSLKGAEKTIAQIRGELEKRLRGAGIECEVTGRQKRAYSIWSKMKRRGVDAAQLYDVLAFRIVTPETPDCYAALGLVHQLWRPVPGRIKDYIAMPKPNFYQSLHTTVMSETAQPFEVQIRTREMDLIGERGIAAHWKYKGEGRLDSTADDARFRWLRQLVDWQSDVKDPRQFLSALKVDLYPDEVYTFTPKGEVFAFPRGATPVDFAYRIHSDLGQRCVGARVNGRLVPLRTPLSSGDIVEILTAPNQSPSRDWLSFVVTSRARHKIRHFIHTEENRRAVELGRRLLEKELKRYKKTIRKVEKQPEFQAALREWGFSQAEEFFAAVGYGKIAARTAVERLVPADEIARATGSPKESAVSRVVRKILPFGAPDIVVVGQNDLLATLAKCCNPLPGEKVIGYITRGRGVSVHSESCPNVKNLLYDPERRIDVAWAGERGAAYAMELDVVVDDRPGLLADLTKAIAGEGSNIRSIEARSEDRQGYVSVALEISDLKHLEKILTRLRAVTGVREVLRRYNVPKAGERESS